MFSALHERFTITVPPNEFATTETREWLTEIEHKTALIQSEQEYAFNVFFVFTKYNISYYPIDISSICNFKVVHAVPLASIPDV